MSVWNKIDSGLASIYANYLTVREEGAERVPWVHRLVAAGGRLNVSLRYNGDLAEIEPLGFQPMWSEGEGRAGGTIDLADLERLAAHPGVLLISFGSEDSLLLDTSVPKIRADQVWTRAGPGRPPSGNDGSRALVGIIDSGIDFTHEFFCKANDVKTTRILRIWDPGLNPRGSEKGPDGGFGYGVQYKDDDINAALKAGKNARKLVRHRDCQGHGTHVASIAAGNGQPAYHYVGVAPGAQLIIVKNQGLENPPSLGDGVLGGNKLFQDAVKYILTVANGRPVVINYSAGSEIGPHDGFTADEIFLADTFKKPENAKALFVCAAGNSGGRHRQHAQVDFPAAGNVKIPFQLFDDRGAIRTTFIACKEEDSTGPRRIDIWYPDVGVSIDVRVVAPLKPMGEAFVDSPALGTMKQTLIFPDRGAITIVHSKEPNAFPDGTMLVRRNIHIQFDPTGSFHRTGDYRLEITSPASVRVHVWCEVTKKYGFILDPKDTLSSPPPPGMPVVKVDNLSTLTNKSGVPNTFAVTAFDAEAIPDNDPVTDFSSAGPLVGHGAVPAQPQKPDIAAPGEDIDAASSGEVRPFTTERLVRRAGRTGTSQAAPHVTGAAALIWDKNPDLTAAQVITLLKDNVRKPATPDPDRLGAGRLDVKAAIDKTTAKP